MNNLLKGIEALLVSNQTNVRYLTGFISANPAEREAYALVLPEKTVLFTNALYMEQAQELVDRTRNEDKRKILELIEVSRETPLSKRVKEILDSLSLKGSIKLGYEDTNLTVAEYAKLKEVLSPIQLTATRDRVEELRQVKKKDEIAKIKRAAKLTDECFTFIQTKIKSGITEAALAWEIEKYFKERGATLAFDSIIAFGPNSSMPHYSPSANCELQTDNLILLDFAANVDGYCADMTRMLFFGTPTDEQKRAYTGLLRAQEKAIDALQNGERSGAALDNLVRNELEKAQLPTYPHSLGHGLGLEIHEIPRLSNKLDMTLKTNMVVTVEPGIYVPDKFGMRIEDLILITDTGCEVLSTSPKNLTIL